ncbi:hypothetical protein FQN57_002530 [Myotisia sp. PD_48]|nr:hypothetical protein FQN57_002530 [Myotisia sp. PD_48]
MEPEKRIQDSFDAAYAYLRPVLAREEIQKAGGKSVLELLNGNLPADYCPTEALRTRVIKWVLHLLTSIHNAFTQPCPAEQPTTGGNVSKQKLSESFEDAKRLRTLNTLLDLISLEGIYPCLSPGVGIPLEQRVISSLPRGVVAKQEAAINNVPLGDEGSLLYTLLTLRSILQENRPSIQQIILGRLLSDLLSGAAELAFHSQSISNEDAQTCKSMFLDIVNGTPTTSLLPVLSTFLQTSSAQWFKAEISSQLSRIPLRKDGVFQTITFLSSQFAPSLGENTGGDSSSGPPITVQAIMQSSRLLSSVPQGLSTEQYFTNIAPKLLSLLDGDDLDLKKTASYVIGNGVLMKRTFGAPQTIGYTIFLKPIFDAFHGNLRYSSVEWLRIFNRDGLPAVMEHTNNTNASTLVNEEQLMLALKRLASLTLLHPNPALLKRLVGIVLLPLWGLYWHARAFKKIWWETEIFALINNFFSVSAERTRFEKLINHLLWNGGSSWEYAPGESGEVSIKKREENALEELNIIRTIHKIDARVDLLLKLLAVDPQREEITGEIFLYVSQNWLLGQTELGKSSETLRGNPDIGPDLQKIINAKIAEKLLDQQKDLICHRPTHTLKLIDQLIESDLSQVQARADTMDVDKPTLSSIGNIVHRQNQDTQVSDNSYSSDALQAALSLLSTILTSPSFAISETVLSLLRSIKSKLDKLLPSAPQSVQQPATTASMLIEFALSGSLLPEDPSATKSPHITDLEIHRQALNNLASGLPPVQVEGLTLLSQLITKSSPVLDIPATLTLLLSLLLPSGSVPSDEFVYLNVIKLIGTLSSKHPRTVVSTLCSRYADRTEDLTLDNRLQIGEALLKTVQGLGGAFVGDIARTLGETMIEVAGRRGRKPKAKQSRDLENQKLEPEEDQEEDIEELGVETANLINQLNEQTGSMEEREDPERNAYSSKILKAWAAGAVSDDEPDDLRCRASAISILASAIQTNVAGLGSRLASATVDMALSTLTLESGPESAILRRATVVLLIDLVKALDTAADTGRQLGFGFSLAESSAGAGDSDRTIGNIPDMLRVLIFVESKEEDSIVRAHIRILIENLEMWAETSILRAAGMDNTPRFGLGDRLAGLDINPFAQSSLLAANRPRIEEIE